MDAESTSTMAEGISYRIQRYLDSIHGMYSVGDDPTAVLLGPVFNVSLCSEKKTRTDRALESSVLSFKLSSNCSSMCVQGDLSPPLWRVLVCFAIILTVGSLASGRVCACLLCSLLSVTSHRSDSHLTAASPLSITLTAIILPPRWIGAGIGGGGIFVHMIGALHF